LFVSISQVTGCEDRLRNDLYCVGWGVKLYSNQNLDDRSILSPYRAPSGNTGHAWSSTDHGQAAATAQERACYKRPRRHCPGRGGGDDCQRYSARLMTRERSDRSSVSLSLYICTRRRRVTILPPPVICPRDDLFPVQRGTDAGAMRMVK